MKHFKVKPWLCRTVFFDLEFYVPEEGRERKGFCYNPWNKKHKFLGGVFLAANPEKDFNIPLDEVNQKKKSFWLWNYKSEKELLQAIYSFLKPIHSLVSKAHDNKISPVLCGINITRSDYLILFELFKRYKILSNEEAFYFQNDFAVVDLSQITIATFNHSGKHTYPKKKNEILQKYKFNIKFKSGKNVWALYDSRDTKAIEERVVSEVLYTYQAYNEILNDFQELKALEKEEKLRKRILKGGDNLNLLELKLSDLPIDELSKLSIS